MLLLEINWYDGVRIRSSSAQEVSTMTKPITLSKRTNKKTNKNKICLLHPCEVERGKERKKLAEGEAIGKLII
jgi:hypothetical protein